MLRMATRGPRSGSVVAGRSSRAGSEYGSGASTTSPGTTEGISEGMSEWRYGVGRGDIDWLLSGVSNRS
jgi:hypothetical protein